MDWSEARDRLLPRDPSHDSLIEQIQRHRSTV
jgi:hypothetical protein